MSGIRGKREKITVEVFHAARFQTENILLQPVAKPEFGLISGIVAAQSASITDA